jgi:hypothetical protein
MATNAEDTMKAESMFEWFPPPSGWEAVKFRIWMLSLCFRKRDLRSYISLVVAIPLGLICDWLMKLADLTFESTEYEWASWTIFTEVEQPVSKFYNKLFGKDVDWIDPEIVAHSMPMTILNQLFGPRFKISL